MKTTRKKNTENQNSIDAVKFMREQRDKLSQKLSKMTKEEVLRYFEKRREENSVKPCS
jgi:hypothetical protein